MERGLLKSSRMNDESIASFMTPSLHTIGHDRSVEAASEMMRKFRIHHLPVLDGGKLVGIVSQRDLSLVDGLDDVDAASCVVADLMSADVFTVAEDAPLADVARRMAREHFGSAIVQRGRDIVGIFTTTDALRALDFLLSSPDIKQVLPRALRPSCAAKAS